MTDLSNNREYYYHDAGCPANNFTELNARGLKTCLDCAGIFKENGTGACVTDRRFDENYDEWKAAEHPEES